MLAPLPKERMGHLDELYAAHRKDAKRRSAHANPKYGSRSMYGKAARDIIERNDHRFRLSFTDVASLDGLLHYVDNSIDAMRQANDTGRAANAARALSSILLKERRSLGLDEKTAATFSAYALFNGGWSAKIAGDYTNLEIIADEIGELRSKSDDAYVYAAHGMTKFYVDHLRGSRDAKAMARRASRLYDLLQRRRSSHLLTVAQSEAGVYHNMAGMLQYGFADDARVAGCGDLRISDLFARSVLFEPGTRASLDCWAHRMAAVGHWKIECGKPKEAIALGRECLRELGESSTAQTARVRSMVAAASHYLDGPPNSRNLPQAGTDGKSRAIALRVS